jgi:2-iminobutanoate/2-iminopropanoate deaminase
LKNLKNLAEDNGFDLAKDTVKNTVYLTDMGDFARVNEVYKKFYLKDYPGRTCIAIKSLPKEGLVEFETVLFRGPKPAANRH